MVLGMAAGGRSRKLTDQIFNHNQKAKRANWRRDEAKVSPTS